MTWAIIERITIHYCHLIKVKRLKGCTIKLNVYLYAHNFQICRFIRLVIGKLEKMEISAQNLQNYAFYAKKNHGFWTYLYHSNKYFGLFQPKQNAKQNAILFLQVKINPWA